MAVGQPIKAAHLGVIKYIQFMDITNNGQLTWWSNDGMAVSQAIHKWSHYLSLFSWLNWIFLLATGLLQAFLIIVPQSN